MRLQPRRDRPAVPGLGLARQHGGRDWSHAAIGAFEADFTRSADTHLIKLLLPGLKQTTLYLKDESTHPTVSLERRLARSLFLCGL